MKQVLFWCMILFTALRCIAQDATYQISTPLDIGKMGWNKTLQMRNGNTVLFHFEPRKGIIMKIFDKEHKEIVSRKHICEVMDINLLDKSYLDGIHDINGEAVIFLTQQVNNRETVLRLRFDATTGKLMSEDKLVQSESFKNRTRCILLKDQLSDEYALATTTKKSATDTTARFSLIRYGADHAVIKEHVLPVEEKGFDYTVLSSAGIEKGEIFITLMQTKMVRYPDIQEKNLAMYYLPKGFENFVVSNLKLGQNQGSFSTSFSYSPLFSTINLLLSANGVRSFLLIDRELTSISQVPLDMQKLNDIVHTATDTVRRYSGDIVSFRTSDNGIQTIIYQGGYFKSEADGKPYAKPEMKKAFGIMQYNEKGEEVWSALLPKSSIRTLEDYPKVFGRKNSETELNDFEVIEKKNTYYILFNDIDKYFDVTLPTQTDSMYTYNNTNAVYYTVSKRKVGKKYLFGTPVADDYKHIYPGSASYSHGTNTYVVLLRNIKGGKENIHLAWCTLQ